MSTTVAAISTPTNTGGIGIIRISGDSAIEVADRVFSPTGPKRLCELRGYTAAHGRVVFEGEDIDECVALVFREPKSYTGENVVELSCHGGLFVLKKALRAVLSSGAEPAGAGEFTKRAFLNGKFDLTEAEAVMDIISAQGDMGAKAALSALDGALSKKIRELNSVLLSVSAQLSAWVDYPDDEIEELENGEMLISLVSVRDGLKALLSRYDSGSAISRGVETAIIGKPNVGKSTLMNLLSGFGRSIVTDIAGTTRDVVEQTVSLGSVILHLADTAGIHSSEDAVEKIGVERAISRLERSGLIFAVFDMSRELDEADGEILSMCKGKRVIGILNKTDLEVKADCEKIKAVIPVCVEMCAETSDGLDELQKRAEELLCTTEIDTGDGMLSTERQRKNAVSALEAVERAIGDLENSMTLDAVNISVDDAIACLLEMTGEKVTDRVIDEVFSRFCVGK